MSKGERLRPRRTIDRSRFQAISIVKFFMHPKYHKHLAGRKKTNFFFLTVYVPTSIRGAILREFIL